MCQAVGLLFAFGFAFAAAAATIIVGCISDWSPRGKAGKYFLAQV